MGSVFSGYGVVILVMAVGYCLARWRVLDDSARRAFAIFIYAVATPALLFDKITHADPREVFGAQLLVAAGSALAVGVVTGLVMWLGAKWRGDEALIAALASSYCNAGNLGVPLAAYVLGDATAVVPVLLFQIAFYAPLTLSLVNALQPGRDHRLHTQLADVIRNPMLVAATAGVTCALAGWQLPTIVAQPITLLAQACVPMALVVFGMSLHASAPRLSRAVLGVAAMKNFAHPLVAWLIAAPLLHLDPLLVHSAVVLAALPTAQNVYAYAVRFNTKEEFARDTGMVSTVVSAGTIMAISVLFQA